MKSFLKKCRLASVTAGLSGAILILAGCGTLEPEAASGGTGPGAGPGKVAPAAAPESSKADKLRKGDMVMVIYSGVDNPPPKHEERIKDDGTISLTLIGSVTADDKTPGQLQKEIQDLYVPRYYRRLTVNVNGEARFFYVTGQVVNPSRQQYLGETTVLKAIAAAGDFNDFAKKRAVELTRANGQKIKVNCTKAEKDPKLDLPVYPGDKIHVPRRVVF